jgi:hypothetical protein
MTNGAIIPNKYIIVSFSLSTNVWGKPFLACHIHNKVIHKKTGKTYYELWKYIKPSLEYLKVWECWAKLCYPSLKIRKLGSKTCDWDFIGFNKEKL